MAPCRMSNVDLERRLWGPCRSDLRDGKLVLRLWWDMSVVMDDKLLVVMQLG